MHRVIYRGDRAEGQEVLHAPCMVAPGARSAVGTLVRHLVRGSPVDGGRLFLGMRKAP